MVPTIVRPVSGRLKVRVPYRIGGWRSMWIEAGLRPEWESPDWRLSRERLADVVNALFDAGFQTVQLEIWGRETQLCDERCQTATGLDCDCVCAGQFHGGGMFGLPIGQTLRVIDQGLVRKRFVLTARLELAS